MKKAGILGGGQLGRMLLQAAANYPVETYVMENDSTCPSAHLCHHFTKGNIQNFDDVYAFGKQLDILTIEIEAVNVEALEKLEEEGVKVYPRPHTLRTIKNKILQKQFYEEQAIPTSKFVTTSRQSDLHQHKNMLPAAHKVAMGGYDGKGVQILKKETDFEAGFNEPSVLEELVSIKKELAIIIAVNDRGQTAIYPPAEMVFDNQLNLLEYQLSPAALEDKVLWKAEAVALAVVKNLKSAGIFAVELFVDMDDQVLVNETAPRVHNSGHQTIEASYSSQFDMLWRVMLQYPLGSTKPIMNSALINLIGEGVAGEAHYENLGEVLGIESAYVHIYGKKISKPGRKMGHVTVLSSERQHLIYLANKIKQTLKVTGAAPGE